MSVSFLLLADLLAKKPLEPATPQIEPEGTSELWNFNDAQNDAQIDAATDRISSQDISPPELSSFWLPLTSPPEPELPPLASVEKYLPILTRSPVTPPPPPPMPQTALRYSSFAISYVPQSPQIPKSGSQLYSQRLAALKAGQIYTRLSGSSFWSSWANASEQPTYEQWKRLLENEAKAIASGQGSNRLSVLLGDSITQWVPTETLTHNRLWLNQGISGDTTGGILNRLLAFSPVRPDKIYLMAGINDLRRGETDATIQSNVRQILRRLRQQHPQAKTIVQSILPTHLAEISNDRIRHLNSQIRAIAQTEGAQYLDIYSKFIDSQGNLRQELTTDGLHLNHRGYQVWQAELRDSESSIALYHRP